MLGDIQFSFRKTQRKIVPLAREGSAELQAEHKIMVRRDAKKEDQLLSDMVISKIRLRKGFWSTQIKLLFQAVPTIWGKAKLRKNFQNGNPS